MKVPINLIMVIMLLFSLSGPLISLGGSGIFVPDPDIDPASGVDVPVWRSGDHWNYSTSFSITYLVLSIPFTGWMNMSVTGAVLDFTYGNSPVYIVNITGNVTGKLDNSVLGIHERIYVELTGYLWQRIQDLSIYRLVLNATVSGTQTSINGDYPFGYEYSPPLEEYDFPLIPGEEWNVNVSARAPFGTSGDLVDIVHNNTCTSLSQVSVPAGTFNCYQVLSGDGDDRLYNSTVGNTVKRIFSLDLDTMTVDAPFELESYSRSNEDPVLELWVDDDQPVWAGDQFTVMGKTSYSNTVVSFFFPNGKPAGVENLIGGETEFSHTLTAPMNGDDTATDFDHGSFGILGVVGAMDDMDVCTITTKAVDLEVFNGSLKSLDMGNGTVDDRFTFEITIRNPSNYGVSNFTAVIDDDDGQVAVFGDLSLEAHEVLVLGFDAFFDSAGDHVLVLTIDPDDEVLEINESNNIADLTLNVSERDPLIWDITPSQMNLTITEGEDLKISASAYRNGVQLGDPAWFLDGEEVNVSREFHFISEYTGNLSSDNSPFHVECLLDEGYLFDGEEGRKEWYIKVIDLDRSPMIIDHSPLERNLSVLEGGSIQFYVNITDPDLEDPGIQWTIDGSLVSNGSRSFIFESVYQGDLSSEMSPYYLRSMVFDPDNSSLNTSIIWIIDVIDVDRAPVVNLTPSPGDITIEEEDLYELSADVTDPDGDDIQYIWYLEEMTASTDNFLTINSGYLADQHDLSLNVSLTIISGPWTGQYNWTLNIKKNTTDNVSRPVPVEDIEILHPSEGLTFWQGVALFVMARCGDERQVEYTWYINGEVFNGSLVTLEDLPVGNYSVLLNVSTNGPPEGWAEARTWFIVKELEVDDDDTSPDEDEDITWWPFIAIALVVLAVAGSVAFILMSRRGDHWEE